VVKAGGVLNWKPSGVIDFDRSHNFQNKESLAVVGLC
jgi:hypothetical protein